MCTPALTGDTAWHPTASILGPVWHLPPCGHHSTHKADSQNSHTPHEGVTDCTRVTLPFPSGGSHRWPRNLFDPSGCMGSTCRPSQSSSQQQKPEAPTSPTLPAKDSAQPPRTLRGPRPKPALSSRTQGHAFHWRMGRLNGVTSRNTLYAHRQATGYLSPCHPHTHVPELTGGVQLYPGWPQSFEQAVRSPRDRLLL